MSRSNYSDEWVDPLAAGRWRQAVKMAIQGKRGQAFLRELLETLEALPDKRLYPGSFATPAGEFCTLGALGAKRGTKMDDLGDEEGCNTVLVGHRFGIAPAMAAEIMYMNDEYVSTEKYTLVEGPLLPESRGHERVTVHDPEHPQRRWWVIRDWVIANLQEVKL